MIARKESKNFKIHEKLRYITWLSMCDKKTAQGTWRNATSSHLKIQGKLSDTVSAIIYTKKQVLRKPLFRPLLRQSSIHTII